MHPHPSPSSSGPGPRAAVGERTRDRAAAKARVDEARDTAERLLRQRRAQLLAELAARNEQEAAARQPRRRAG